MDVDLITAFDAPESITTIDEFDGPALSVNSYALSDHDSRSAPPDLPCEPDTCTGAGAALVDRQTVRSQYLLMSVLEFLAKMFGKSVNHSERLFDTFKKWLGGTELNLPFFYEMEETIPVRHSCYVAFSQLIQQLIWSVPSELSPSGCVVGAACAQLQPLVPCRRPSFIRSMPFPDVLQLIPSRFKEEFIELGVLGRGGFGKVLKVRNRIDGCEYAVKRVMFKQLNHDVFTKVLREVKVFASLDHPNIVRYHSAWLEHSASDLSSTRYDIVKLDRSATDEDSSIVFASATGRAGSEAAAFGVCKRGNSCVNGVSVVCDTSRLLDLSENDSDIRRMSQTDRDGLESTSSSESEGSGSELGSTFCMKSKQLCQLSDPHVQTSNQSVPRLVLYIHMQLCVLSLREWLLQRNQKVSSVMKCSQVNASRCNTIFRQIVEGVHYLHCCGLMHRDLKPANVFLHGPEEEAKIGDFGLARDEMVFEHAAADDLLETVTASRDGCPPRQRQLSSCVSSSGTPTSGIGTSTYAPPEQLAGGFYNTKADMYSLGLILAELFHPFSTGMERASCLRSVRGGHLPEELIKTWPQQSQLIQQLVSSDPSKRPEASTVLRMDFLQRRDEVVAHLKETVEKQASQLQELTEVLAEKEDMITSLQQQLREAKLCMQYAVE